MNFLENLRAVQGGASTSQQGASTSQMNVEESGNYKYNYSHSKIRVRIFFIDTAMNTLYSKKILIRNAIILIIENVFKHSLLYTVCKPNSLEKNCLFKAGSSDLNLFYTSIARN